MSTILAQVITPGTVVDYTPGSAVTGGAVVVQGDLVGVATGDIAAGELGSLMVDGVVEVPKPVGAMAAGAIVYWDEADDNAQTDSDTGTNKRLGKVITAAASADTHVTVLIDQG